MVIISVFIFSNNLNIKYKTFKDNKIIVYLKKIGQSKMKTVVIFHKKINFSKNNFIDYKITLIKIFKISKSTLMKFNEFKIKEITQK